MSKSELLIEAMSLDNDEVGVMWMTFETAEGAFKLYMGRDDVRALHGLLDRIVERWQTCDCPTCCAERVGMGLATVSVFGKPN